MQIQNPEGRVYDVYTNIWVRPDVVNNFKWVAPIFVIFIFKKFKDDFHGGQVSWPPPLPYPVVHLWQTAIIRGGLEFNKNHRFIRRARCNCFHVKLCIYYLSSGMIEQTKLVNVSTFWPKIKVRRLCRPIWEDFG